MRALGLVKRKEIWVPTWRGWLVSIAALSVLIWAALSTVIPFLAPTRPHYKGILVVEGWLPDYALGQAKKIFETNQYRLVLVTGGPIDHGIHISQAGDFARLGVGTLQHLGMNTN